MLPSVAKPKRNQLTPQTDLVDESVDKRIG
jgi:hypothetical protein